jgi:mono/diheme cytochrome c family protein
MSLRISVVSAVCAALITPAGAHAKDIYDKDAFADYQPDTANGAVMFAAGGCATCHAVDGDNSILAGGEAISTKFGDLYAPNITADATHGIGNWSNGDFLNAVTKGVSPEGRTYFGAVFPFASYARMAPEDVLDLRAHIAALTPSDSPSKEHDISYLSQTILDFWTSERAPITAMSDPQKQRGQYLVEAVGHCAECHTPRDTSLGFRYEIDSTRAYKGEVGLLGNYAPDISPERLKVFGPEAFITGAMANGLKLNGNPMAAKSMRRISRLTAELSLADRAAVYAYLSGDTIDPSKFADTPPVKVAELQTETTTDALPTTTQPSDLVDMTNAPALMSRVNAYCEAQNPTEVIAVAAPAPTAPTAADPALTAQADQVIETYCRSCHAPGKTYGAVFPTGDIADMPFDKRIVISGNPDASPLYESIASNRMPLGQKMSTAEVDVLKRWIEGLGAPVAAATPAPVIQTAAPVGEVPMPLFAGGARQEQMLAIVADISATTERDRPHYRYFSFANTPLVDIDCTQTGARRNPVFYLHAAFNKFVNSISMGPRVVPVTVLNGTEGAIVRIDMRDYGWSTEMWDAISTGVYTQTARASDFSEAAWNDLATVYPYGIDANTDPLLAVIADATRTAVPVMRADWFTHFGSEAPYYDMFLGLTSQIRDLEARIGLDIDREIQSGRMIRAAMLPGASGVSDHNRMLERFELPRGGYYWKSYDFAGDSGRQSLTLHPDGPEEVSHTFTDTEAFEHDGGEMIFSLPNGLQGYYLSTNTGERLLVGPASIVSFRTKPIGKGVEIENARSCFDCHANGMIAKRDQLRDVLMTSQRYSREQLDRMLQIYIPNEQLSEIYKTDSAAFLTALSNLNATETSPTGRLTSLAAPSSVGGGEIFTYLADQHFNAVDLDGLAREFHMDVDTLRARATRIGDPRLTVVLADWLGRLDGGAKLHRSEIETYYTEMLPRLTDLRPYKHAGGYVAATAPAQNYEAELDQAVQYAATKTQTPYTPAETAPLAHDPARKMAADRLKLALSVPATTVYVNDLLEFDISATQRCELQIFYVEEGKAIEELPQAILGPQFLEAGEVRRIPFEASGLQIRFDTPGTGETMLAYCRAGGLGHLRMDEASVAQYAHERSLPLTRGISIEAASQVADDKGASATNHVTFNVLK